MEKNSIVGRRWKSNYKNKIKKLKVNEISLDINYCLLRLCTSAPLFLGK